jgi:ribose 5-phosphate isomerase B
MPVKSIAVGCDHAGYPYKDAVVAFLEDQGIAVMDFGTHSPDSVDYPDFVHPVANAVESSTADLGVLLCGSGNGVAITANKHQGIRAALCWQEEIASLAREHNNANVVCLPVRFVSEATALQIVQNFLNAEFEGGRHQNRVNKIPLNC